MILCLLFLSSFFMPQMEMGKFNLLKRLQKPANKEKEMEDYFYAFPSN